VSLEFVHFCGLLTPNGDLVFGKAMSADQLAAYLGVH
jgi:hypothetical protein